MGIFAVSVIFKNHEFKYLMESAVIDGDRWFIRFRLVLDRSLNGTFVQNKLIIHAKFTFWHSA